MRAVVMGLRWGMLCTAICLAACAHKQPPPRQQTFHYRAQAHALAVGAAFNTSLVADSANDYADAVKFHLAQTGTLTVDARSPKKVAVLVFGSGKRPLVQTRSGKPIDIPLIDGDVFVVIRALRGTKGAVQVALASSFAPAPEGTQAAPVTVVPAPGEADDELAPPGETPAQSAKSNDLPLDDL